MNEAILGGLLEAGTNPMDVVATVRRAERAAELAERHHGITAIAGSEEPDNNKQAAKGSDVVILGVKPIGTAELAREISGSLAPDTIVISVEVVSRRDQRIDLTRVVLSRGKRRNAHRGDDRARQPWQVRLPHPSIPLR